MAATTATRPWLLDNIFSMLAVTVEQRVQQANRVPAQQAEKCQLVSEASWKLSKVEHN